MIKISIITVVFNNEEFIESCINSVVSQRYPNKEYIIIDGSSTDNTKSLIVKHLSEVAKFVSEPDNGIYDAMNKGIKAATGDVIGILNSDDLFEDENVLSNIAALFNSDPGLDIVYGNLSYVLSVDTTRIKRRWISVPYYSDFFEDGHVPPHPTLYIRKRVYEETGLFNINYKLAADYEYMLRLFKKHDFKSQFIPKYLIRMRLGGATNKNITNIIKGNKEILLAWKANELEVSLWLMPKRIYRRLIQFVCRY